MTFTPSGPAAVPVAIADLAVGQLHALGRLGLRVVTSGFHLDEGPELAWMSAYRLMAGGRLLGIGREATPTRADIVDGDVVVELAPSDQHPVTLHVRTTVVDDRTVDTTFTATAHDRLVDYEVLVSSYATPHQTPSFRIRPYAFADDASWFRKVAAEHEPTTWTRDSRAAQVMFDGRWTEGVPPIFWILGSFYAEPLMVQRHRWVGIHAVTMTTREVCFAVSGLATYHNSQYFHLFGQTVEAGQVLAATIRLVLSSDDDPEAAALVAYDRFLAG